MTFELLQHSIKCLFLLIKKVIAIIHISSWQLTYKDSILHYKIVKITINASSFVEVILDIVVCHHCLLGLVITNNMSFFLLKI